MTKAVTWASATYVWLVCVLMPQLAWACPYCAGQNRTPGYYWVLGALILLPFPTAGIVMYVFKKVQDKEES